MHLKWYILSILLIIVLASCSGSQNKTTSSNGKQQPTGTVNTRQRTTFDPCALFSKSDVSKILGTPVIVQPDFTSPLCTYGNFTSNANPITMLQHLREVFVAVGSSNNASQYFAFDKAQAQTTARIQDIHGVGDEAFTVSISDGTAIIGRKSNIIYSITMVDVGLAANDMLSDLRKLADEANNTISRNVPSLPISAVQPCMLVTPPEASQVLHNQAVNWLFTANNAGVASCDYLTSQGAGHRITIVVHRGDNGTTKLFEQAINKMSYKKELRGIGDAAFYDGYSTIWVRKGAAFFHITAIEAGMQESIIAQIASNAAKRFS